MAGNIVNFTFYQKRRHVIDMIQDRHGLLNAKKVVSAKATKAFRFFMRRQPFVGQMLLIIEASRSHSDTTHPLGLLWMNDQPNIETSTWKHVVRIKRQTSMPSAGFEPAIPKSERPQTHALEHGHWDQHQSVLKSEYIALLVLKIDTRWVGFWMVSSQNRRSSSMKNIRWQPFNRKLGGPRPGHNAEISCLGEK